MLGYDAPEVWHHGEKERSKVYKQYAELNNVDMATAKAMVDAQSDAYETDNKYRNSAQFIVDKAIANKKMDGSEKYYNAESLGKFILDERDTDKDVAKSQMTAFDIFGAGERATDYAEKYTETNPNGLTDPAGFATDTDKKGAYGRRLIEDKKLATEMIANGEAIPGSNDPIEYAEQMKVFNKAKKEKKGLFASKSGTSVLEAMQQTGYVANKLGYTNKAVNGIHEKLGFLGRALNTSKAVGSSLGGFAIDIANGVGYITSLYDLDEKALHEKLNKGLGYDSSYSEEVTKEFMDVAGKLVNGKDVSVTEIAKVFIQGITTPEVYGELMGFIVGTGGFGGLVTKGLVLGSRGGKVGALAEKFVAIEEAGLGSVKTATAKLNAAKEAGLTASAGAIVALGSQDLFLAATELEQHSEDYATNNNGIDDRSITSKVIDGVVTLVLTHADRKLDIALAKGSKAFSKKGLAVGALDFGAELATEEAQTANDMIQTQQGTSKYQSLGSVGELLTDNTIKDKEGRTNAQTLLGTLGHSIVATGQLKAGAATKANDVVAAVASAPVTAANYVHKKVKQKNTINKAITEELEKYTEEVERQRL